MGCVIYTVYSMEVEGATATATTTAAAATVIAAASIECSRGASRTASEQSPDVTAVHEGGSTDVSLLPSDAVSATVAVAVRAGGREGVVLSSALAVGSIVHGWIPSNASADSTVSVALEVRTAAVGVSAAVSDASMTPRITGATGSAPVPVVEVGAGRVGSRVGEGRGLRPAFMRVFIAFRSFVLAHSAHTNTHTHTHTQGDKN